MKNQRILKHPSLVNTENKYNQWQRQTPNAKRHTINDTGAQWRRRLLLLLSDERNINALIFRLFSSFALIFERAPAFAF